MSSSSNIAGATPEQVSNHRLARLAGLLYFSMLPTTGMGVFSAQPLLANGGSDAAAQIAASRSFLELGVLVGAVGFVTWLVVAVLFYALFRSASDRACKLLVVFVVASAVLFLAALARRLDALSLVAESQQLALGPDQLRTLVALTVQSSDNLMQVSMIFWGLWLAPLGFLVYRSGFLPRTLGVLLLCGAVFYVANFVGTVLQPQFAKTPLAQVLNFAGLLPGTVREIGTGLWLMIRGTRGRRRSPQLLAS